MDRRERAAVDRRARGRAARAADDRPRWQRGGGGGRRGRGARARRRAARARDRGGRGRLRARRPVLGTWLLISLNHWNLRQERTVVLCARALLRVKLDFAAEPLPRVQRVTRVDIVAIRRVELGALRIVDAEAGSFVEDTARDEAGLQGDALRVTWGAAYEELSPAESWNPKHVPGFTTLLSYRLAAPPTPPRPDAGGGGAAARPKRELEPEDALPQTRRCACSRPRCARSWSRRTCCPARRDRRRRAAPAHGRAGRRRRRGLLRAARADRGRQRHRARLLDAVQHQLHARPRRARARRESRPCRIHIHPR